MRRRYDDIPQPFNRALGPRMYRDEYKREEIKEERFEKDCSCEPYWQKEHIPPDRRPPHAYSREKPHWRIYPDGRMPYHDPPCEDWHENWQRNRPFSDKTPPCIPVCEEPQAQAAPIEAAACSTTEQCAYTGGNQSILLLIVLLFLFTGGGACKDNVNCF